VVQYLERFRFQGEKYMKLVSVAEMQVIEREADAHGLTFAQMMENAGLGLAREVMALPFDEEQDELDALGLVGPGNNGGDTLVALAFLAANGWMTRAYLIKRPERDLLVERFRAAGGQVVLAANDDGFHDLAAFLETASVVLDGVLGTGTKLPLRDDVSRPLAAARDLLARLEELPVVIAVDCPSGVDCDSGVAAPETIPADLTITMAAVKQGLLRLPAYGLCGGLRVTGIGLRDDEPALAAIRSEVANADLVRAILPPRKLDAHKGTFGTALVAAGSLNYTGAALLAGEAAYRIGAGLVTLAVPAPLHAALAGRLPEATWVLLPHEMGVVSAAGAGVLIQAAERATALLVGPGLGLERSAEEFMRGLLDGRASNKKMAAGIGFVHDKTAQEETPSLPPLVVDADGLKLLAQIDGWAAKLPGPAVLTPHPGEMAALIGIPKDEIQRGRQVLAEKYAAEWGHVVVLKGAFTVVAAPDGRTTTIPVATPALARAGTGDVLAGLIVGLRAQGVGAYEAAVAGAWIHAQAGLLAEGALGGSASVLAGDVLAAVPDVLAELAE
jgi:NAD(P)H-hydrate epimerase